MICAKCSRKLKQWTQCLEEITEAKRIVSGAVVSTENITVCDTTVALNTSVAEADVTDECTPTKDKKRLAVNSQAPGSASSAHKYKRPRSGELSNPVGPR